jgi:hypothetical protein
MFDFISLSRPEGDDAADRVVWRYTDSHAITWNNFDSEAAHTAAQLREDFVSRITLHAIETAGVDGHDGALHVDQIVFTQYLILRDVGATHASPAGAGRRLAISVPHRRTGKQIHHFQRDLTACSTCDASAA